MSHRDQDGHIAPGSHSQDLLAVFRWLLADADLSGIRFRADSSFSARGLILRALLWVWSDQAALARRFAAARKIADKLFPWDVPASVSYQAFLKRLVRWTGTLVAALTFALRRRMQATPTSPAASGSGPPPPVTRCPFHWPEAGTCSAATPPESQRSLGRSLPTTAGSAAGLRRGECLPDESLRSEILRSEILRSGSLHSELLRSGSLHSELLRSGSLRSELLRSGSLRSAS